MKTKLIVPLILILALLTATLVACGEGASGPYTVKYVVDGAVEKSATIEKKADIGGFYTPEKEGYSFDGWFLDKDFSNQLTEKSSLQSTVIVYAKLTKKSFKVEFVAGGNVVDTQTILYGESATAPTPPTIKSQVFEKWDTDFTNVKSNLTVTAIYTPAAGNEATFILNGQTIYSCNFGAGDKTSTAVAEATKRLDVPNGFEFVKWASLLDKDVPAEFPDRDVTYKAVLKIADMGAIVKASFENNAVDYSKNNLTFTADHTEYEGIKYGYIWYLDGVNIGDTKVVETSTPSVGDHKIKVIISASSDYAESISEIQNYNFVVNTATLSSMVVNEATFEYDGNPHCVSVETLSGDIVEYRTENGQWSSTLNIVNAGEYDVYVRITRENYHPYETPTPVKLTITKRTVKGTITPETISYGDYLPSTYKVNYTGFVAGDNQSVFSGNIEFSVNTQNSLNIGTYTVKGNTNGYTADNYILDLEDGVLTITKRVLIVSADSKTITLGDPLPTLTITYTGFALGEDVSNLDKVPSATCGYTPSGVAGKYAITVSGGESDHYHFVYREGTLTVNKQ